MAHYCHFWYKLGGCTCNSWVLDSRVQVTRGNKLRVLFIGLVLLSAYHWGLINGTIAGNCQTTINRGPCHVFRFFLSTVELSFHRFFPASSLSFPTHGSPYNKKIHTQVPQCVYQTYSHCCYSYFLNFAGDLSSWVRPLFTVCDSWFIYSFRITGFCMV